MTQTAIPYLFMRGGTSRGPYFNRADLPEDLDDPSSNLLIVDMGAISLNSTVGEGRDKEGGAPEALPVTPGGSRAAAAAAP